MIYKPYLSLFKIKLIAGLQYRVASLASMTINLFWGLILSTILMLFYTLGDKGNLEMTLSQGITYIWFGQCFINLAHFSLDNEIYQKVQTGDYVYELCRPLNLYNHWFARSMAIRVSSTLLKSVLALIVCLYLLPQRYRMQPPVSTYALLGTILVLFGALILSCAIANIINVILLRVEMGLGLFNLFSAIVTITSGTLIPLYVYPDWIQSILRMLPFAGTMDFPASIYTGLIPVSQIWYVLIKQLVWIVILILLGKWRMKASLKKAIVQGG